MDATLEVVGSVGNMFIRRDMRPCTARITLLLGQFMHVAIGFCSGRKATSTCSLRRMVSRKLRMSRHVQMLT